MHISHLDHLVLTVRDVEASAAWYGRVLGMERETFTGSDGGVRVAVRFGNQKINFHQAGREWEPKAARPTPGSADLCFIAGISLNEAQAHFDACGVPIELGPVERTGAAGAITSLYIRDPDQNLIEVSVYSQ